MRSDQRNLNSKRTPGMAEVRLQTENINIINKTI